MILIDFHIHSKYSFDCFLEPAVIIEAARKSGLSGLAVTDHDTMAGVDEFRALAPDLMIIPGEEVTTEDGDILGLFLREAIAPGAKTEDVIRNIHAQGGLAVLAHPFKWPHLLRRGNLLKQFDAIEVFNARNNIPVPHLENFLARRALATHELAGIAGSDTHEGFELGCAATEFDCLPGELTEAYLKNAILTRQARIRGREVSLAREIVSHFSRNLRSCMVRR